MGFPRILDPSAYWPPLSHFRLWEEWPGFEPSTLRLRVCHSTTWELPRPTLKPRKSVNHADKKIKSFSWATEFILQSGNSVFVEGWGGRRGGRGISIHSQCEEEPFSWRCEEENGGGGKKGRGCLFCVCEMGKQLKRRGIKSKLWPCFGRKKVLKNQALFWRRKDWRGRLRCFPLEKDGEEEEESDIYMYRGNKINSKSPRGPQKHFQTHFGLFSKLLLFLVKNRHRGVFFWRYLLLWEGQLSLTGAPYPGVQVERIQISPIFFVKNEIGSKVVHFSLFVSFWLPLLNSKITQ